MARISTYVKDTVVTLLDKWIGTDSNGGITKNFTAKSIADLFNSTGSIGVVNQANFFFQDLLDQGRKSGSISFTNYGGNNTAFSDITSLKISKKSVTTKTVTQFLNSLVSKELVLADLNDLNKFGVYKLISLQKDAIETDFLNAELEYVEGNSAIDKDSIYGIAFYSKESEGDKFYQHIQSSPSNTWNVNHDLSKFPSVTITLSTGQQGYGDVTYIDENNLTISFAGAESGKAYIN